MLFQALEIRSRQPPQVLGKRSLSGATRMFWSGCDLAFILASCRESDGKAGRCESREVAGAKEGMGPVGHREPEKHALGSGMLWPPQREAGL